MRGLSSELPRRSVVAAGVVGVVATALGAGTVRADAAVARVPVLRRAPRFTTPGRLYHRGRFHRLRKRTFQLRNGAYRRTAVLTAVRNLPHAAAGDELAFELVFRARSGRLADGTYELRRPGFRATSLFLVADPGGRTARAVVNRRMQ